MLDHYPDTSATQTVNLSTDKRLHPGFIHLGKRDPKAPVSETNPSESVVFLQPGEEHGDIFDDVLEGLFKHHGMSPDDLETHPSVGLTLIIHGQTTDPYEHVVNSPVILHVMDSGMTRAHKEGCTSLECAGFPDERMAEMDGSLWRVDGARGGGLICNTTETVNRYYPSRPSREDEERACGHTSRAETDNIYQHAMLINQADAYFENPEHWDEPHDQGVLKFWNDHPQWKDEASTAIEDDPASIIHKRPTSVHIIWTRGTKEEDGRQRFMTNDHGTMRYFNANELDGPWYKGWSTRGQATDNALGGITSAQMKLKDRVVRTLAEKFVGSLNKRIDESPSREPNDVAGLTVGSEGSGLKFVRMEDDQRRDQVLERFNASDIVETTRLVPGLTDLVLLKALKLIEEQDEESRQSGPSYTGILGNSSSAPTLLGQEDDEAALQGRLHPGSGPRSGGNSAKRPSSVRSWRPPSFRAKYASSVSSPRRSWRSLFSRDRR